MNETTTNADEFCTCPVREWCDCGLPEAPKVQATPITLDTHGLDPEDQRVIRVWGEDLITHKDAPECKHGVMLYKVVGEQRGFGCRLTPGDPNRCRGKKFEEVVELDFEPFDLRGPRPQEPSEPAKATRVEPEGLQFAKAWMIGLAASDMKPMEIILGSVIREHVSAKTLEAFIGSERIAEMTGWDERNIRKRRAALVKAGWLIDTGKTQGRAKVFRLNIPG